MKLYKITITCYRRRNVNIHVDKFVLILDLICVYQIINESPYLPMLLWMNCWIWNYNIPILSYGYTYLVWSQCWATISWTLLQKCVEDFELPSVHWRYWDHQIASLCMHFLLIAKHVQVEGGQLKSKFTKRFFFYKSSSIKEYCTILSC